MEIIYSGLKRRLKISNPWNGPQTPLPVGRFLLKSRYVNYSP